MIYVICISLAIIIGFVSGVKMYIRHSYNQFVEQLIDFHAEEVDRLFKNGYDLGYQDASTDPMNVKNCYITIYGDSFKKD